jgi:2-(1,2-epoxy-1,2-dihydrophenyl)acetyl-CoA isomerase
VSTPLQVEREGAVLTLTLNRAESANAIDLTMARALAEVARDCEADSALSAVVLTGAGSRFCAGGAVRSFAAAGEDLPKALRELTMYLHAALASFARMTPALITAVNGVAAGAGLGLAAAGDICIAARSATFRSAYTAIGLSPDAGSTWALPRLIGARRAQELVLTNRVLDAERALAWGLVTEVVEDGDLLPRARAVADDLARLPRSAIGASKRLIAQSFGAELADQLEREAASVTSLAGSEATRAAISAFVQRPRR